MIKVVEYVDRQASVALTFSEFRVVPMEIILRSMRLWPSLNQSEKSGQRLLRNSSNGLAEKVENPTGLSCALSG